MNVILTQRFDEFFQQFQPLSVDIRVKRIYRHLTATPSFGGEIAGAGRPFQMMEMPLDDNNMKDSKIYIKSTDTDFSPNFSV